jgi:hypothetical protein
MIIFCVSDGDHIVQRESEFVERGFQTGCFVHSRGQNHHSAFVKYHLVVEAEFADGIKNGGLVWLPGSDDAASCGDFASLRALY